MSCDGLYAMQLATALRSVVESNRWPVAVYILHDNFPPELRRKVENSLPFGATVIEWIAVDLGTFEGLAGYQGFSKVFYSRLLIPNLLPLEVKRVLYLDTDILVLDDLGRLWETDLEGAPVGAVRDGLASSPDGSGSVPGVPPVQAYFNSGVLLIDVEQWRSLGAGELALEYLKVHRDARFPDQNALNVIFDGRWKMLDQKWNFQGHHGCVIADLPAGRRPPVVHFVTAQKPWVPQALSLNASLYDGFRSRTAFARSSVEICMDKAVWKWSQLKRLVRGYVKQERAPRLDGRNT